MRTLFLTVALVATANVYCMEEHKKVREDEVEKNAENEEGQQRRNTGSWQTKAYSHVRSNWIPYVAGTGLAAYCLWDRQALSKTFSWGKNLCAETPNFVKGLAVTCAAWKGWNWYTQDRFSVEQRTAKDIDDTLSLYGIMTWLDFAKYENTKLKPALRQLYAGKKTEKDVNCDMPDWLNEKEQYEL